MKQSHLGRGIAVIAGLFIALVITFVISFTIGRYGMTLRDMWDGLTTRYDVSDSAYNNMIVMVKVRLPRILGAMLLGGALAMSGAAFQGVFGNPLVSPDLLGASSGAGLGACIAVLTGCSAVVTQAAALTGGIVATALTCVISRAMMRKKSGLIVYVLVGVVVTAIFEAGISISKYVADPYSDLETITYWLMGKMSSVSMESFTIALVPIAIGFVILCWCGFRMNLLSFSDEEAMSMGINVRSFRLMILFAATLMCSASVATAGVISWVGLVVPHIARLLVGPDNRRLLPVSFLAGSIFLLLIDDIARTILSFEIPISILTGAIGAPVFIILLLKRGDHAWK